MNLVDIEDKKIYTLTDLESFFREKNIPKEKIRFFVNENRNDPKCFGIYQDINTGDFIVYKNKADGSRYIRYQGSDEAEAVSIFFDKLKEEMYKRDHQGLYESSVNQAKNNIKKKKNIGAFIGAIAVFISIVFVILFAFKRYRDPKSGYYHYDNNYYYYGRHRWWYYDDYYDDWYMYDGDLYDYDDYYYASNYDSNYGFSDIEDSYDYETYDDSSSNYHYSDDDFDSYDFDSWDYSDTDWGSDW